MALVEKASCFTPGYMVLRMSKGICCVSARMYTNDILGDLNWKIVTDSAYQVSIDHVRSPRGFGGTLHQHLQ